MPTSGLHFGDIDVDVPGMRVRRAGTVVPLEPKAFDLLVCLARQPGRLVSKDDLVREVWHGAAVTDNAITRVVAQLRRSLGDTARHPRYIETVPTRGYRFVATLAGTEPAGSGLGEPAGDRLPVDAAVPDPWPVPVASRRPAWWLVAACGLLALVVGAALAVVLVPRVSAVRNGGADLPFSASLPAQVTVSAGLDLFPTVSPDGTAVAYATDRSGQFEIVVKALSPGGGERAVTSDGHQNVQPVWSPDGRYLAYHSRVRGGIWLVPALGGVPRPLLVSGTAPAWSPDGEWIAYQTSAVTDLGPGAGSSMPPSTLRLVRVASGEQRALTERGRPEGGHGMAAWWPDGSRVVFVRGGTLTQDVWTVPLHGGAPAWLAECRSVCLDPFFGPDGALYLSDGRQPRLWRLVVDQARGVARGPMTAVNLPVGGNVRRVSVSVNRRIAAFAVVQIRSNLASVAVGPDGAAVGGAVRLTNDTSRRNTNPTYSPDGRRIAYSVGRAGVAPDIWTIEADGSNPVQMTLDAGSEGGPQWSPDGREVLFKAFSEDDRLSLRAIDVESRRERSLLAFDPPGTGPLPRRGLEALTLRASPDLSTFVYTRVQRGVPNVFLTPAGRAPGRALTTDPEGAAFPVVSARGDRVAVQLIRGDTTQLGLVPIAGGPVAVVTTTRGQTWINSWSPDGRFIAAAVMRDGVWNVASIDTATGRERLLTGHTTPRVYVRYPDWARTGSRIVFEEAEVTGNIWVSRLGEPSGSRAGIW